MNGVSRHQHVIKYYLQVKTHAQFLDDGCDNCESFLGLAERQDRVSELTSHTFEGMMAVSYFHCNMPHKCPS